MLVGIILQISIIILFRISLKIFSYAQFYSFYAADSIILHLAIATIKY